MTRARRLALSVAALVIATAIPGAARAADFLVFPIKISLSVYRVIVGFDLDKVVDTKLKEKDLINLALGRPLGTKIDKKTEVLGAALTSEGPSNTPLARLIVFDPTQGGSAGVKALVAAATHLDFDAGPGGAGQGAITAVVQQTSHGNPVANALNPSTVYVTGAGIVGPLVPPGTDTTVKLQGSIVGSARFTNQGNAVSGVIVTGKAKIAGKVLGSFTQ
jgi:hypothetical protein